ncbi:MAG: GNAT family N-acetyltransferase [Oscillatoriophycideae cyanobacterium NC_groundwater_1537_Pr4_S-0.65um_50_18]|nr:GNAT family N-acetyltransferase [Oscillatoriophycideae cyanobacterium NC_groundwater_1537_Pr4_S-0.65um_50_18]
MKVIETERLVLRRLSVEDSPFILELLNDPSWLRFIGDKGVRTLKDAHAYIVNGPLDMYARLGFGLYLVELKSSQIPIGLCGLLKRDSLENVDIGFALLPEFRGQGYAYEAASAVMEYGRTVLGLEQIVAIASTDNKSSAKLLTKIGFKFKQVVRLVEDGEPIRLFTSDT